MSHPLVLMNPGPVNVSAKVRRALGGADICHREKEFSDLLVRVRSKLLKTFDVPNSHTAAFLSGSGTLAVESMLSSYGALGKKVLVLSNGVYGERLVEILSRHRVPHRVLNAPIGDFPSIAAIRAALAKDRSISAIAMVHHETSTGQLNPLKEVALLAKNRGKTLLVDAVSSLGAEAVNLKAIDFCAVSAGKCLHAFPGLSIVIARKKAAAALENSKADSLYLDLGTALKAQEKNTPPFTPAVQLFYALDAALDELIAQSLKGRIASYAKKSALVQNGLEELGIQLIISAPRRSHVLTSAWLPKGLSYEVLHRELKKSGFVIYAGQSKLQGRIFRISNMGAMSEKDLKRFLSAFASILKKNFPAPKAIVLAAGVGKRFGKRTRVTPKCLVPLGAGETLLKRYLDTFREVGIKKVVIVCGHLEDQLRAAAKRHGRGLAVRWIRNRDYRKGSVLSLHTAGKELHEEVLVMDADVFFPSRSLRKLLNDAQDSSFLMDPRSTSAGEEMMLVERRGRLVNISKKPGRSGNILGEATGIVKLSRTDALRLRKILRGLINKGRTGVEYEEALAQLMKQSRLGHTAIGDVFWSEMDFERDLKKIKKLGRS